ncbi:unnamed protein product [Staurois parvus]|uniref:Uncharacterized protein n=1 Tax=Staurois parvus TaxID=386267 RepID=A0ABN9DE79_9NEOB|nr:unnamed protein product [Staurois parvus]
MIPYCLGPHELSVRPWSSVGRIALTLVVSGRNVPFSVGGPMRCPWYLFHRLF